MLPFMRQTLITTRTTIKIFLFWQNVTHTTTLEEVQLGTTLGPTKPFK
mgnify:CR=1 FL=1|jgi:hypothetical protein